MLLRSWVAPDLTNGPALVAKFDWLVPPKRLMPAGRELTFPEFCFLLFTLGGANVTKEFVPLGPGGANVPFVPRGAGVAVDPIMLPPDNPEGESVTVGVGVEAWALPMEGFGTKGVPPGIVAVALAAVATRGLGTTMGKPPGVVVFALAAAATAAALLLGGGEEDCDIVALLGESWV